MLPSVLYGDLAGRGLAPATVNLYARTIQTAQRWFVAEGLDLDRARASEVAAYVETLPHTWSSRTLARISLGHWWELVDHPNPPWKAFRVPPKPTMECRAVEEDEARILAKAARERGDLKGLAVLLGLYTAMRRAEIAALEWESVNAPRDGWIIVHGKGAKTRELPLHRITSAALAAAPRTCSWVFPGRRSGKPVVAATIWKWVREVSDEAGCGLVPTHVLRHTALSTVNDTTGDLRTTQHFAGHVKPETTAGYTRSSKRRLSAAVEALDY